MLLLARSGLSDADRHVLGAALDGDELRFDEPMARHTTLRLGGPADAWAAPSSVASLARLIRVCAARRLPITPLGGGCNLLVRDRGIRGVAVSTRRLRGLIDLGDGRLAAEAGVTTGRLLQEATARELGGLEFLGGVPGSLGGGLIMNAGTYLGELKDVTRVVQSLDLTTGALVTRPAAACGFGYRTSALPPGEIVVGAELVLTPRPRAELEAAVRALRDRRRAREPSGVANAGSTFKNPPGLFAGKLIEEAGLRGRRVGGAEVSPVHANWLVNTGSATARDLLELIALVRDAVAARHGVALALEQRVVGE
jgi:UDP-N-acetylmuramate dehydrogenase